MKFANLYSVFVIGRYFIAQFPTKAIETVICVWKFSMMTSSNGNIFRVTCHLCGEFTGPR